MSRVAVVGAGTMGNGIAHVFAQHGWETALVDVSPDALDRGLAAIEKNTERQVQKGVLKAEERRGLLRRITTHGTLEAAQDAELVVEAATENPEVKFAIFRDLDRIAPTDAILASNTSSISITTIAAATQREPQVIGMHF
ncbi:MAG: 3-hydroxyacyl-CoA dehydrogenase family protein, partial [Gemmatimonadales bacterium]